MKTGPTSQTHVWYYTGNVDKKGDPVYEAACDQCGNTRWSFFNGGVGNRCHFDHDYPCEPRPILIDPEAYSF